MPGFTSFDLTTRLASRLISMRGKISKKSVNGRARKFGHAPMAGMSCAVLLVLSSPVNVGSG